jgi:hypothetical protein
MKTSVKKIIDTISEEFWVYGYQRGWIYFRTGSLKDIEDTFEKRDLISWHRPSRISKSDWIREREEGSNCIDLISNPFDVKALREREREEDEKLNKVKPLVVYSKELLNKCLSIFNKSLDNWDNLSPNEKEMMEGHAAEVSMFAEHIGLGSGWGGNELHSEVHEVVKQLNNEPEGLKKLSNQRKEEHQTYLKYLRHASASEIKKMEEANK